MAGFLPSTSDASGPGSDDPRVIGLDSDVADDLLSALSSRTARRILTELHEDPASPSALANRIDSSLQNTQYHLERLEDAGLIEVGDTVYSEKGREMKVYVPADRALVVVAGREEDTTGLRATLRRLLGGVGILGVASLVVDRVLGGPTSRLFTAGTSSSGGRADGGNGGSGAPTDGGESGGSDASETTDFDVDYESGNGTVSDTTTAAGDAGASTQTAVPTQAEATSTPIADATEATASAADGVASTPIPDAETTWTTTETAVGAADPTTLDTLVTSPGILFFLGGLAVLVVGLVVLSASR